MNIVTFERMAPCDMNKVSSKACSAATYISRSLLKVRDSLLNSTGESDQLGALGRHTVPAAV